MDPILNADDDGDAPKAGVAVEPKIDPVAFLATEDDDKEEAAPNGVGALADMGGNAADDALVVVVFNFVELNGVGAFADMGGNAAAEEVVVAAFVVWAPNGVGALTDIGGNAAEDVLLGTEEVVVLVCKAPKGVGAFADMGGNAADDDDFAVEVVGLD